MLSVLSLFLSFLTFSYAHRTENTVFDQNRLQPIELLKDAYYDKEVLLIGTSNHANFKHYERVLELLEAVGSDPQLRYIVMERSYEATNFYELLSTFDLDRSLKEANFSSSNAQKGTMCDSPEWSYTISQFFPKLREINRKRFPLPPIIVKTLESVPAEYYSAPGPVLYDGTCSADSIGLQNVPAFEVWGLSNNREKQTAQNFRNEVWSKIAPQEKVIVISHYMHLLSGFAACRPVKEATGGWVTNLVPLSWMMEFLDQTPEARDRMNLIINDEVDRWYNPEGGLKVVKRQASRYEGQSFAFKTKIFEGLLTHERGAQMFLPSATINRGLRGQHFSDSMLHELAFGIIWNSDAEKSSALQRSQEYLPQECGQ